MTEPDPPRASHDRDGPDVAPDDAGAGVAVEESHAPSGGGPDGLTAPTLEGDAPVFAPLPGMEPQGEAPARPSYLFLALLSTVSVIADLGTKVWAEKTLVLGAAEIPAPKVIIKGVLTFFLAKNRGGAWGFLQHQPEKVRKPFFVLVSIMAILLLVGLYRRVHPEQKALKWGLPLVFGGAVGNLVDRIRYGHVIDFIDVQATWKGMAHHWPTFNVADVAICVGVGLMAVDMFTPRKESVLPPDPPPSADDEVQMDLAGDEPAPPPQMDNLADEPLKSKS